MAALDESTNGDILLEIEDIHMYFGKVQALDGVSLKIRKGEIHSVIGPNGAGKTVMMNCVNGLYHQNKGNISFKGKNINKRTCGPVWALPGPFRKLKFSAA